MTEFEELKSPYQKGVKLTLRTLRNLRLPTDNNFLIPCEITHVLEPFSFSCVMKVKIQDQKSQVILKLFDRRFASSLRRTFKTKPATRASETAFADFVKLPDCPEFINLLHNVDNFHEPKGGWDHGRCETYLYDQCLDMFDAEKNAYDTLKEFQGTRIPHLLAEVQLELAIPDGTTSATAVVRDFYQIKGVLLEFIDGCSLDEIPTYFPEEDWDRICSEAVENQRQIDTYPIRNEDVRTGNIIVTRVAANEYRIVTLDFGLCEFREEDESEGEWGLSKWQRDEEGQIGRIMQDRLKRNHGHHWDFQHSLRFDKWAPKEDENSKKKKIKKKKKFNTMKVHLTA